MTYTLISHQELGGAQASIVFNSIPQTFTDLYLVLSLRVSFGDHIAVAAINFNGAGLNSNWRRLVGAGATNISYGTFSGNSTNAYTASVAGNFATNNTFANQSIYIPNYRGSTTKSYSSDFSLSSSANGGSFPGYVEFGIVSGFWNNTAAINSITINSPSGNLVANSSATLYGITAGSSGGVVVS